MPPPTMMPHETTPTSPSRHPWNIRDLTRGAALWQGVAIGLAAILVFSSFYDITITRKRRTTAPTNTPTTATATPGTPTSDDTLRAAVLPTAGMELPVAWGNLGTQLVTSGAIDLPRFLAIYEQRGGLSSEVQALLDGTLNGRIRITEANADELLNVLWAFGLANTNAILAHGPMNDPQYGGAGGFASTGGWTLAVGDAMGHYNAHAFVTLTPEQQALVERVSQGIYRPCCGNSVYFPDCNHGMAMLGLLEILAAQNVPENDLYRIALQVNSYWFPSTYLTVAKYEAAQGTTWDRVDAKKVLGAAYSSSSGFRNISAQVEPVRTQGGGSCGV